MARPKEGNFKTITLNLDPKETEEFCKRLKYKQSLSEVFRQYIHDDNVRFENEKNLNAPNYGAIRVSKTNYNYIQSTLNTFISLDSSERFAAIKEMDRRLRVKLQVCTVECLTQLKGINKGN